MADLSNQIVGVCRFSYPSDGGFSGPKRSAAELEAFLFSPERLAQRFAMFETLVLPSLAAQSDPDFRLVVLIGEAMPPRWKRRMRGLAEHYRFLRICSLERLGPLVSTRRAFRRGLEGETAFVTGFRIDDDDAVAVDYVARTRALAEMLLHEGQADADRPAVVAFHRGIYWNMVDTEQPFYEFTEKTPLGLASAMITPTDGQVNIFRWNHRRLPAHVRCWTDPDEIMFLRTLHQSNDSDRSVPGSAKPLDSHEVRAMLQARFGIDPDAAWALMEPDQLAARP
ncbi:MAG: glycosyltransferase [Pseudomonadota bacterium]